MMNYTDESTFLEKYKPFRKFWTILSPHYVSLMHALAKMIREGIQFKNYLPMMRIFLQSMKPVSKIGKTHKKSYLLRLLFG